MSVSLDDIINGSFDAYEFIGVDATATASEIKRQYRRKALVYHPDKDSSDEARKKFHLLSQIYEILTNEQLREEYNRVRLARQNRAQHAAQMDHETRRFREELERAEREHLFDTRGVYDRTDSEFSDRVELTRKVDLLKEEGLKLRRRAEQAMRGGVQGAATAVPAYTTYRDIDVSDLTPVTLDDTADVIPEKAPTTVRVSWKYKPELGNLFDANVLAQIMSIFGRVRTATVEARSGSPERYESGVVEFELREAAEKATQHDYRKSTRLWDGTAVRKLSSLLRECTYTAPSNLGELESILRRINDPKQVAALNEILGGTTVIDRTLLEALKRNVNS